MFGEISQQITGLDTTRPLQADREGLQAVHAAVKAGRAGPGGEEKAVAERSPRPEAKTKPKEGHFQESTQTHEIPRPKVRFKARGKAGSEGPPFELDGLPEVQGTRPLVTVKEAEPAPSRYDAAGVVVKSRLAPGQLVDFTA